MRRVPVLVLVMLVALVGIVALSRSGAATAHDATPDAKDHHPVVGTWLADTDTDDPESLPSTFIFSADGAFQEVNAEGDVGLGRWEATGDRSVGLTIWFFGTDEDGEFGGTAVVRAEGEVSEDGQTFTATYTLEFVDPDGTGTGQYGPANAMGTRLAVEPMGSPVGSMSDLFEQFEGTPEATPAP